ncbi:MAG: deoxyguanosinetriphosphate triphosphohydrolase [Clostridia bacterium]|nr:deoxyguanosinetriphosphate triphosphohydrolase [Clostridia bacterium]
MGIREQTEQIEKLILSPYATLSCQSLGRDRKEPPCEMRTVFQRDRDRIIHCKAFRRLKHKTQVYLAPGNDHYRTRLVHTLEVSQIARGIARSLRLNEDLTEAISLGHDLGHTPFGHAGERVLDIVLASSGGFRHYEQGVRVVEKLENDGKGLNLTKEVRDGIMCHTKGPEAFTPEGRIVRIADKIAYMNHDIDDSIRAGILSEEDIPAHLREILGTGSSRRINNMILNVYRNSHEGNIGMSEEFSKAFYELHSFLYRHVYKGSAAKVEEGKAEELIEILFNYLCNHPNRVPGEYRQIMREEGVNRAVADYIAGMSDTYVIELYKEIFIPRGWEVHS